jgi:hypothetical protein
MSDMRVIISRPLQHGPRWMTEAIQRTDSWNTVTTRTSGERIGVDSVLPLIADGLMSRGRRWLSRHPRDDDRLQKILPDADFSGFSVTYEVSQSRPGRLSCSTRP